jgi:hypothetical protein
MSRAVKISDQLANKATTRARAMNRSTAGQVEYWANIGQIAEDNPDLSYSFIKDILISLEEYNTNQLEEYRFGEGDHA